MGVVPTNPETIRGPWIEGFVLDRHILHSTLTHYIGDQPQFDTVRTALGELVFQFKNRGGPPDDIIATATEFIRRRWAQAIDCVTTVPPSINRARQPGVLLAAGIGRALGIRFLSDVAVKAKPTAQMKNVAVHDRAALLNEAIQAGTTDVSGLSVLIVDDLWETGGTMRRTAEVVASRGARQIRALAMTRTK